jgi:hypothetical protein
MSEATSCAIESQCAPRPLILCILLFIRRWCERITAEFPDYRKATALRVTAYGDDLYGRATRPTSKTNIQPCPEDSHLGQVRTTGERATHDALQRKHYERQ